MKNLIPKTLAIILLSLSQPAFTQQVADSPIQITKENHLTHSTHGDFDLYRDRRVAAQSPNTMTIVYTETTKVSIDLTEDKSSYVLRWIDPNTGEAIGAKQKLKGEGKASLTNPATGASVLWLSRK